MKMDEIYRQLVMYGAAYVDGDVIFYNYINGSIIRFNIGTGKSNILWKDPTDDFFRWDMYGGAEKHGNEIVFAPRCADNILIIHLDNNCVEFIPYETDSLIDGRKINQFVDVHLYRDYYYFFPGRNDEIIKIHKDTHELSYIGGWSQTLGEVPVRGSVKFSNARRINEELCMLACFQKGKVLEFHMGSDNWKIHDICDEALSDIVFDGKDYWISQRDIGGVIKWNPDRNKDEVRSIKIEPGNILKDRGYIYIIDGGESLFLVPFRGNAIVKLYKNSGDYDIIPAWDEAVCADNMKQINQVETNAFSCKRISADLNLIYDAFQGNIIILNAVNGTFNKIPMCLSQNDAMQIQKRNYENSMRGIITENTEMNLSDLVSYVSML